MNRALTAAVLFLPFVPPAVAQTASTPAEFEVASVKPYSQPIVQPGTRKTAVGRRGGPGTNDPGQITWTGASLRAVIMNAYSVKSYQVTGPEWLDSERFDILAKVPEGTTKEQALVMWQSLLASRFGLKLHRENKEIPVYELTVGKGGPKMKEAEPDPPPPSQPSKPPADGPAGPVRLTRGTDGCPVFPGGRGGTSMMMMPGRFQMCAQQMTVESLCNMLTGQLSRPVFDKTGLTGKYNFKLEFEPEGALAVSMPPAGGGGIAIGSQTGPPPDRPAVLPNPEPAPPLAAALQNQLGLKLEARKAPAEILVIDKIEKTPTEN